MTFYVKDKILYIKMGEMNLDTEFINEIHLNYLNIKTLKEINDVYTYDTSYLKVQTNE